MGVTTNTIRSFSRQPRDHQPWEGRRAPLSRESTPVGVTSRYTRGASWATSKSRQHLSSVFFPPCDILRTYEKKLRGKESKNNF